MIGRRPLALCALAAAAIAGDARAAPIRTESPGIGAVRPVSLVERLGVAEEDGGGETVRGTVAWSELRYAPTARWLLGLRVPAVLAQRVRARGLGEATRSGLGDLWADGQIPLLPPGRPLVGPAGLGGPGGQAADGREPRAGRPALAVSGPARRPARQRLDGRPLGPRLPQRAPPLRPGG